MSLRWKTLGAALAVVMVSASLTQPVLAKKKNCANDFRSGKLYFSQKVYDKSVEKFAEAVAVCPEKWEYRARYAMALAQYAGILTQEAYTTAQTKAEQDSLLAVSLEMFRHSGAEFDSATVYMKTKKARKFVRENREHFWAEHYNRGLKLAQEEKYKVATRELEIARLIDPGKPKAYLQGAVVFIKAGDKRKAAELVKAGLAVAPDDKELNKLLGSIYVDAARDLIDQAEKADSASVATKLADEAIAYVDKVLDQRAEDPNVYFERALANLTAGSALARESGDSLSAEAVERFRKAAEDFAAAAKLAPPEGENREFHLNALFNRVQALLNAKDVDEALAGIKGYLNLSPTDPAIWRLMAQALVQKGDTENTMMALTVNKSLKGREIPVDEAVKNAQKEELDVEKANGKPDAVWTFQEASSGDQINTWFWFDKKLAVSFKLGLKINEISWATE